MTFEDYLASGGDRDEKLITIWKTHPEKLSDTYRSFFTMMDSDNPDLIVKLTDHNLYYHLQNWDRIKKDLIKQGADFV